MSLNTSFNVKQKQSVMIDKAKFSKFELRYTFCENVIGSSLKVFRLFRATVTRE